VGLVIVVLALYAALVGGRPSVLRASIMFAIVTVGIAFRRPPNLLNAIGAAGIVLLIIRPAWLADIGFQLSFGATLGIAYLLPHFDNWVPDKWRRTKFLWKWILLALGVSLSATLGTVPLVAYHFHRIQIIAPLANLLILPPLGLIVGYGIVASIFSAVPFLETVSVFFLYTDWLFLRYLLIATSLFAKLPFCSIAFPHLSGWWIVGYYGILVLLPPIIRRRFRGLGGGVLFLIIVVSAITIARIGANYAPRDELRVTFFDIGQGDCALVELSDGRKMLIDGGPPGNAIFAVEPYLRARGIDKIDAVLITHTDSDHLGGVADLASDFDYDVVYVPYLTTSSVLYAVFLDSTKSAEIPVKIIHAGETIPNFSELTVLWPDTTAVSTVGSLKTSPNEASIVLLLERDEAQFLFTGDIGTATENKLVELWSDIDADILKVPHHGSRYSSSEQFIAATTPLLAIISVGRNNYGHPTPEAIERYTASGTEIIRTDRGGAVTLTIDGDSIFYEQFDGRCGGFSATDQPARVNP